jgi:cyclopropane-fatty-acyl-phospholipid synthase
MDGWWDCKNIDEMICRLLRENLQSKVRSIKVLYYLLRSRLTNMQKLIPYDIEEKYYDIGNNLFIKMLDKRMVYTCGYNL